jgi:hypothetical protein
MKGIKLIVSMGLVSLGCVGVLVLVTGPFLLHWKSHDLSTHVFNLGEYRSWLQGGLTPLVVIIAFVTVYIQILTIDKTLQSQRDTNNVQRDANKKLLMGIMLDNIQRFNDHVNYLAFAVYHNERRSRRGGSSRCPRLVNM